jgi:ABC-type xylose transport system permease subunit
MAHLMSRQIPAFLFVTDVGFILYWGATFLMTAGVIALPADWLFKDYHDATVVAWNWSFMPLDLIASFTGIAAIMRNQRGQSWQNVALVSMTLTFCAGFMALCFWTFQRSFDLSWWLPNIFLTLWPPLMAKRLRRQP